MAHSPRYESRIDTPWRDLYATLDALQVESQAAPPWARRKAPTAVARALHVKG